MASGLPALVCTVILATSVGALTPAYAKPNGEEPTDQALGVDRLVFTSRDYDWTTYFRPAYVEVWKATRRELKRQLKATKPEEIKAVSGGPPFECVVEFKVGRDGKVSETRLIQTSRVAALDQACLAVAKVSLPDLPSDFAPDIETVRFSYRLNSLPDRALLKELRFFF